MLTEGKLLTPEQAAKRAEQHRREERRLVTVNGSFDLLHAGHIAQLEEARSQGDFLFVGLNSDASVSAYKGAARPIIPEHDRARVVAALACVSYIVLINEREAGGAIIELIRPHVHANGSEYGPPEQWVEYPVMLRYGVQGYACSRRPGLSTTDVIQKIQRTGENT